MRGGKGEGGREEVARGKGARGRGEGGTGKGGRGHGEGGKGERGGGEEEDAWGFFLLQKRFQSTSSYILRSQKRGWTSKKIQHLRG